MHLTEDRATCKLLLVYVQNRLRDFMLYSTLAGNYLKTAYVITHVC